MKTPQKKTARRRILLRAAPFQSGCFTQQINCDPSSSSRSLVFSLSRFLAFSLSRFLAFSLSRYSAAQL
jgi:hypothetical protein